MRTLTRSGLVSLMLLAIGALACGDTEPSAPITTTTSPAPQEPATSNTLESTEATGPQPASVEEAARVLGLRVDELEPLNDHTRAQIAQACEQGLVNADYLVADGGTWIAGGQFNRDAHAYVADLEAAGIASKVARYCELGQ